MPEKVDLFQLNVEVWCDCGLGAEEQEGLLGAGQGFRAGQQEPQGLAEFPEDVCPATASRNCFKAWLGSVTSRRM